MVKTVNKFLSSGHLEFIVSTVFNVWPQSAGNCRIFHDSSFSPISLIFLDSVGLHVVDVVCIRYSVVLSISSMVYCAIGFCSRENFWRSLRG